ncbi:MAG TPA: hypothetical protein ENH97_03860 [bacterium]|nr:hypothetical protein [bacterium]
MTKKIGTGVLVILLCLLLNVVAVWGRGEVIIAPADLDRFSVTAPSKVTAGEVFPVTVTARDSFGNIVSNYRLSGKGVEITTSGMGKIVPERIAPLEFKDGVARISLIYEQAQDIILTIAEIEGEARGKSTTITVFPFQLDHFVLTVPREARAGEEFTIFISARDAFGNIISDYSTQGKELSLLASGNGKLNPSKVEVTQFKEGIASLSPTYSKAQKITLTCKEEGGKAGGTSSFLTIQPGAFHHFLLSSAPSARAGESFEAIITAYDSFENVVTDYGATGKGVFLSVTGSGKLNPSQIPASQFADGVAKIRLSYDRAEPITISAKESALKARREVKEGVSIIVAGRGVLVDRIDGINGWAYVGDEVRYVNIRIDSDAQDIWREVPRGKTPENYQAIQKLLRKRGAQ